jgi:hypothetical protein
MYSLAQEDIPDGDLYYVGLEGFDPKLERSLLKQVFIIMMNSKSKVSANSAVNKWLKENFDTERAYKSGAIPYNRLSAKQLISHTLNKHKQIADHFYKVKTSVNNVANITSEINDYVVGSLLDKKILVVQIHDGFVVQADYREILFDTMKRAYETILGDSYNCRIKQEF